MVGSTYIPGWIRGFANSDGRIRWYIKIRYCFPDRFRIMDSGIPAKFSKLDRTDFAERDNFMV